MMVRKRIPLVSILGSIVLVVALYAPSAAPAWALKSPGAASSAQASGTARRGPGALSHATSPTSGDEAHKQSAATSQQAHTQATVEAHGQTNTSQLAQVKAAEHS